MDHTDFFLGACAPINFVTGKIYLNNPYQTLSQKSIIMFCCEKHAAHHRHKGRNEKLGTGHCSVPQDIISGRPAKIKAELWLHKNKKKIKKNMSEN